MVTFAPPPDAGDGIRFSPVPDGPGEPPGQTRAELFVDGKSVSRLTIIPLTIRIGCATVHVDGIGSVETDRAHRHRGYSRRVLEATVAHMRRGDAALTMLYGIRDFYPKFGYTTAGADHLIYLTRLWADTALSDGWAVRPFEPGDFADVSRLYDRNTRRAVGAAVRASDAQVWQHLLTAKEGDGPAGCRVAVDGDGRVRAYAWRARHFWYARLLERQDPDAFVLSEVMAESPAAAEAILAGCRLWARDLSSGRGDPYRHVLLAQPPEGPVAAAAALGDARSVRRTSRSGDSMAQVLNVDRLLVALSAELRLRLAAAAPPAVGQWPRSVRFVTEIGEGTLRNTEAGGALIITLPQTALARLALGAYDSADQLDRLDPPVNGDTRRVMEALFPQRHPHLYIPDRY